MAAVIQRMDLLRWLLTQVSFRLLKSLPPSIPAGKLHNFFGYIPDPQKVVDTGCVRSVVSHRLEISFGPRQTPAGDPLEIVFKSGGPALKELVTVLRNHIIGNAGTNLLLTLWVDSLTRAAVAAINASGNPLPRPTQVTAGKRLLEDKATEELARKKQKQDEKAVKDAKKSEAAAARRGQSKEQYVILLTSSHDIDDGSLRDRAMTANAHKSLGARVVDVGSTSAGTDKDMFAAFRRAGVDNKTAARTAHIEKTNFLTMNFICHGGVAPALVNNCSFRAPLNHLEPGNGVKVASTFSSTYIPAEAARVTLLAIEELKKHYNLTLGYDGGTTLKQQSIYTFHVTTPDREASSLSLTVSHRCTRHNAGVVLIPTPIDRNPPGDSQPNPHLGISSHTDPIRVTIGIATNGSLTITVAISIA
ncbi:hypothetical protein B0H17DRAFT_1205940 [Mycena rosella]|uniref:Uncharacterized protein n=1 Tax=Mycena rosella TaxID=1033263 RepID=A0AAD7D629_MYCRO|nr:hypothetical protein B0H17DRAFT_1205940 [Mycena rosella]